MLRAPSPRIPSPRLAETTVREPESGWWSALPESEPPLAWVGSVTIAVVGEAETRWGTGAVVARLAELAATDELVIVYGAQHWPGPGARSVVAGLRGHLPRHDVVAVPAPGYRGSAALAPLVEGGSLPVVTVPDPFVHDVTAELASGLGADRVVRFRRTVEGVEMHQVWSRAAFSLS
ncbi:hypothetical protein SAMN05421748_115167 [Paractinoplanes atraurantiacus]|uniref:Uncharacterized protein n=2 Tax=Paractinoplanes atraurantiacus TaxID=1036182 RepID=A0A285J3C4_9ACTN|nr:hypothetical protein SAMN05421748_115167 [Actinoplanes atraurantiacus]